MAVLAPKRWKGRPCDVSLVSRRQVEEDSVLLPRDETLRKFDARPHHDGDYHDEQDAAIEMASDVATFVAMGSKSLYVSQSGSNFGSM